MLVVQGSPCMEDVPLWCKQATFFGLGRDRHRINRHIETSISLLMDGEVRERQRRMISQSDLCWVSVWEDAIVDLLHSTLEVPTSSGSLVRKQFTGDEVRLLFRVLLTTVQLLPNATQHPTCWYPVQKHSLFRFATRPNGFLCAGKRTTSCQVAQVEFFSLSLNRATTTTTQPAMHDRTASTTEAHDQNEDDTDDDDDAPLLLSLNESTVEPPQHRSDHIKRTCSTKAATRVSHDTLILIEPNLSFPAKTQGRFFSGKRSERNTLFSCVFAFERVSFANQGWGRGPPLHGPLDKPALCEQGVT